jgi:hypothetical protein
MSLGRAVSIITPQVIGHYAFKWGRVLVMVSEVLASRNRDIIEDGCQIVVEAQMRPCYIGLFATMVEIIINCTCIVVLSGIVVS